MEAYVLKFNNQEINAVLIRKDTPSTGIFIIYGSLGCFRYGQWVRVDFQTLETTIFIDNIKAA